jgi:RimJ/RimL family protein N-acetyltransferase
MSTIETDRLILRPHSLEDFADSAAMWSDPVVIRYTTGRPSTDEEAWARVLRNVGHWTLLGFGYFVLREKASGRFVGEAGFADFKRDVRPSFDGAPEAGWVLMPWAHGRGLATEAVRAVLAWMEARFGAGRTVCMIDPENAASIRVAQKCGYREWTRSTYKEQPVVLYQR